MSAPDQDADVQRQHMAQRLREAREYVGMSQDDVAGALKISRPAVSNIESGTRKVEAVELDKLARLYGRTVQFFLTGEEDVAARSKVEFLARKLQGLSAKDLEEVARFADFLKGSPKSGPREGN